MFPWCSHELDVDETPEEDKEVKMKSTFDLMGYTMASGTGRRCVPGCKIVFCGTNTRM